MNRLLFATGGALYYNVGAGRGSGTGDKILNKLVHDTTDSSIIDYGVHASGYGGDGICSVFANAKKAMFSLTMSWPMGNTGKPDDYLLARNPVAGFDYTKTNDTIRHAGRNDPVIMPPKVPHTFPTYTFTEY